MGKINRRDCLKVASMVTLPSFTGQAAAVRDGEQQHDYVTSETVLDEVCHFPHPDEGDIVRTNGKFLYVEIEDDANPDPRNSWIESHRGKHHALTYPRNLWVNDSIKHTVWAELIDDEKQFFVDHGMLFEIPPGSKDISLYVEGVKQNLESDTLQEIGRNRSDFSIRNVAHEKQDGETKLSIDVANNLDRPATFRTCVNVTSPLLYTRFIVEDVGDEKTIEGSVFHGDDADPEDVEVELITAHGN